jgi:IMP and pyridine-specific 5'-nucleotidase
MFSSRRRNYMIVKHRKDGLVEFFRDMLSHSFVLNLAKETVPQTFGHFEELIEEHRADNKDSKLRKLVPTVGTFFTPLPLREAYLEYDDHYHISQRRFVPISFDDVRHILNLAQAKASAPILDLVTFDGDQTLYSDGKNFNDVKLAQYIIQLLDHGIHVALVTAAGYGLDADKYEVRIGGLLDAFRQGNISETSAQRFYVLGGECNYLLRCNKDYHLEPVNEWFPTETGDVDKDTVNSIIDVAENTLLETIDELGLNARVIRKERACGMIHGGNEVGEDGTPNQGSVGLRREVLDEACLRVMDALGDKKFKTPYCAFNGGNDVWVDVGNKRVGVSTLQTLLGNIQPDACLHVGDQMYETGNDIAARGCCPTMWIANPTETKRILMYLLDYLGKRLTPVSPERVVLKD